MSLKQALLDRIEKRDALVAVVGLGYVGLPLAVEFAEVGFRVIGLDISAPKVEALNRGESYIPDIASEAIARLVKDGRLRATTRYEDLRDADAIEQP